MEHVAAILLLIACSDDLGTCTETHGSQISYETMQDCDTDLPVLTHEINGRAPAILGTCLEVDPALVYDDAEIVWDVSEDGKLSGRIQAIGDPELYAMRKHHYPGGNAVD